MWKDNNCVRRNCKTCIFFESSYTMEGNFCTCMLIKGKSDGYGRGKSLNEVRAIDYDRSLELRNKCNETCEYCVDKYVVRNEYRKKFGFDEFDERY